MRVGRGGHRTQRLGSGAPITHYTLFKWFFIFYFFNVVYIMYVFICFYMYVVYIALNAS